MKKNNLKKDKIIVLGISAVAVVLIASFLVKSVGGDSMALDPASERVMIGKGRASTINFTVPSGEEKQDNREEGLLDQYAKADAESERNKRQNREKVVLPDMGDGDVTAKDAYSNEDDAFMRNVQEQLREMESNGNAPKGVTFSGVPGKEDNAGDGASGLKAEMEYRKMLLEARENQMQRSQDYSAGASSQSGGNGDKGAIDSFLGAEVKAAIYKDQLILPGERVTMILKEESTIMGSTFPKNTLLFGMASLNKSRVVLEVSNINHVRVGLQAYDVDDGMRGLYSAQAAKLWNRYEGEMKSELGEDVLEQASRSIPGGIGRMVSPIARSMGNFFRRKNVSNRDKILLVDDDQVILKVAEDE